MTVDRVIHGIIGLIMVSSFVYAFRRSLPYSVYLALMPAALLGTWVPDWDLWFGIGFHRNPMTHSLLPAVMVALVTYKLKLPFSVFVGFTLGLASHLLWDIVDYGNVIGIDGGNADRLFLLLNGSFLILVAALLTKNTQRHAKAEVVRKRGRQAAEQISRNRGY